MKESYVTRCIAIHFRLYWRHSDDLFVLARNLHKGPEGEIFYETGNEGGKEGPREDRERERVDKEGQKRTVGLR